MIRKCMVIIFTCSMLLNMGAVYSQEKKDRYYFEKRGDVVWEVPTDRKVICLTFDDGPDSVYTPKLLEVLKQHQATATFFVTGNQVEHFPEIVREQVQAGHEIANHTYSHAYLSNASKEKMESEIKKAQASIFAVTGKAPTLFRPPGGYYSEKLVNVAKDCGYTVIMWSWHQETKDWSDPGVHKIVQKILKNARNGDIVLLHDHSGDRNQTITAVSQIIPELRKRGYEFITVSELLKIKQEKDAQAKIRQENR